VEVAAEGFTGEGPASHPTKGKTMGKYNLLKTKIKEWQKQRELTGRMPHQGQVWTRYKFLMSMCLDLIKELEGHETQSKTTSRPPAFPHEERLESIRWTKVPVTRR